MKVCRDCKYYRSPWFGRDVCAHPRLNRTDPVTGRKYTALNIARAQRQGTWCWHGGSPFLVDDPCGPEGEYWEALA